MTADDTPTEATSRRAVLTAVGSMVLLGGCATYAGDDADGATPTTGAEPSSQGETVTDVRSTSSDETTSSPTPTREQTPIVAQIPPENSVDVAGTTVDVIREHDYAYADTFVDLVNTGDVTFSFVEIRVSVFYESVSQDRTHVVSGYARHDGSFGPGDKITLSPPRRQMRYIPDGRAEKQEGSEGFSASIAYREVHYSR